MAGLADICCIDMSSHLDMATAANSEHLIVIYSKYGAPNKTWVMAGAAHY
jgi:hypothetical protein